MDGIAAAGGAISVISSGLAHWRNAKKDIVTMRTRTDDPAAIFKSQLAGTSQQLHILHTLYGDENLQRRLKDLSQEVSGISDELDLIESAQHTSRVRLRRKTPTHIAQLQMRLDDARSEILRFEILNTSWDRVAKSSIKDER